MKCTEWVTLLVMGCVVVGLFGMLVMASTETVDDSHLPETHTVIQGETYWSIAREYWPNQHTGERAFQLREMNGIAPDRLRPGQVLRLRNVKLAEGGI